MAGVRGGPSPAEADMGVEVILAAGRAGPTWRAWLMPLLVAQMLLPCRPRQVHERVQSPEVEREPSLNVPGGVAESPRSGIQMGVGRLLWPFLQALCQTSQFFPFSVSFRNVVQFSLTHLPTLFLTSFIFC